MVMTLLTRPKKSVATVVVATDGSGDYNTDGTDDDIQIQAAIDSLPATGGCIYMKEGDYTLTNDIVITVDNIAIMGCGRSTRIQYNNAVGTAFDVNNCNGVIIENLLITIPAPGDSLQRGVYFNTVTRSTIRGCWFEDNIFLNSYSVDLINSTDCFILNNYMITSYRSISLNSSSHRNIIVGNNLNAVGDRGIILSGDNNKVIGNYISAPAAPDPATYGVLVAGDNNIVEGNSIISGNTGVNTTGDNNIMNGNNIGADDFGILTSNVDNNIMNGNYINTDGTGIYIFQGNDSIITDNYIKATDVAIRDRSSSHNIIFNNIEE